jgi:hypothetical protein
MVFLDDRIDCLRGSVLTSIARAMWPTAGVVFAVTACGAPVEEQDATTEVATYGEALDLTLPHTLHNKKNMNQCLGVAAGNMANGTPVITWTCDGSLNQLWYESLDSTWPSFHLMNDANCTKCLSDTANGAAIADQCAPNNGLFLSRLDAGGGCFFLQFPAWWSNPGAPRYVLGVDRGIVRDGQRAVRWFKNDTLNEDQIWCPQ